MATEVYTTEEIKLRDGTAVTLKPLAIRGLRKFMRAWGEYVEYLQANADKPKEEQDSDLDVGDKQFEVFLELCSLCLAEELKQGRTDEEFIDYLDRTLDEQTIYRILDKCGGLKLNDPNLQAAALAAATSQVAGTN